MTTIELPRPHLAPTVTTPLGPAATPGNATVVLLVDDQRIIGQAVGRLLMGHPDLEFHYCDDPQEAIMVANQVRPTVILQDLVMPEIDGLELVRLFRAHPATAAIPIVVLSTLEDPVTKRDAFAAGANDYLVKLPDKIELLARIDLHSKAYLNRVQRDEAHRGLRTSQQQLHEANVKLLVTNQQLQEAIVETRQLQIELATHNQQLEEMVAKRTNELRGALDELQAAQSRIIEQERAHAFGVMASGVAHDFNNVLCITLGYAELLLGAGGTLGEQDRVEATKAILTASQDGARMVSRLREFHRPGNVEEWERVDMGELIQQAVELTRPKWQAQAQRRGASIEVRAVIEPVPPIKGLTAELRELLTNLIFNAVDAIAAGGSIVVRTRAEANQVVVEVVDTGSGMTEEVRQRCLEPFFTTKGQDGTGMGLAMVYGIAQRHEAWMEIDSQVGKGTTFRFRFPASNYVADAATPSEPALAHPLKILVVDDQPFICQIMTQYLQQDCHFAQAESEPLTAVARLSAEHFDLLITDQVMPEISGRQLARLAREISPTTRVMLLTGFGADEPPEEGAGAIDLVVGKPITQEALRRAVATCSKLACGCCAA